MNPLIENKVILTLPIYTEWRKSGRNASYKKTLMIFTAIMLGFLALVFGVFYYMGMPPIMLFAECIFILAVYIWIGFFQPNSRIKSYYKYICRMADGTPERIARFYEDYFTVTNEAEETREFLYENIENIRETDNLYVLIVNESDVDVLLEKNSFVIGDFGILENKLKQLTN